MAHPAHPAECRRLCEAARNSKATVLFDFVEVFNPHSFLIRDMLRRLAGYRDFRITQIRCERSKDREDPRNPRNRKVIVPIQYQETAHCLAMLLFVTDRSASFAEAFPQGMTVAASAAPYDPPNPEDYRYGVVDGKVTGEIRAGDMTVRICTDFKRRGGVPFKCFSIEGVANRRAFRIESVFDGTREKVLLNGKVVATAGRANRHQNIIRQALALAPRAIDRPAAGRRFRLARLRNVSGALGELPRGSGGAGRHGGRTAGDDEIAIPRASPSRPAIPR